MASRSFGSTRVYMTTARRPRARAAASWTSSTFVIRGWRTSSNSCSGNWRSTASASLTAVSPVESDRTWISSTSGISVRDLGEVAQDTDRVAHLEEQAEAVGANRLVLRHDEHLVEEPVDGRPELGRR